MKAKTKITEKGKAYAQGFEAAKAALSAAGLDINKLLSTANNPKELGEWVIKGMALNKPVKEMHDWELNMLAADGLTKLVPF